MEWKAGGGGAGKETGGRSCLIFHVESTVRRCFTRLFPPTPTPRERERKRERERMRERENERER